MFLRLFPTNKFVYIPIEVNFKERFANRKSTASSVEAKDSSRMALSRKTLAGSGYVVLNGIRVLNIIGFLMVIAASLVLLVKTDTSTPGFFFFNAVSHVLTILTCMFLTISELSLFRGYFARNWPLLSQSHGFVALAIAMLVIGINTLGDLNSKTETRSIISAAFWRIVIASGIVIFALGWINLLASYIFRDRAQGITARQVRAHGAVAALKTPTVGGGTPKSLEITQSYNKSPVYTKSPTTPTKISDMFRTRTVERTDPVLPSYRTAAGPDSPRSPPYPTIDDQPSPSSRYSRATNCTKKKVMGVLGRKSRMSIAPPLPVNVHHEMEISAPIGVNPQFAHLVQRPDSALHPSRTGETDPYRWRPAT